MLNKLVSLRTNNCRSHLRYYKNSRKINMKEEDSFVFSYLEYD
jgi:hypothetical protein